MGDWSDSILVQNADAVVTYHLLEAVSYQLVSAQVAGCDQTAACCLEGGMTQGRVEVPSHYNDCFRRHSEPLVRKWRELDWGFRMGMPGQGVLITFMTWADNLYWCARSFHMWMCMAKDIAMAITSMRGQ